MNKRSTVVGFIFLFFLFQGIAQQYRFFNDQNPKFYIKEIEREDWQIIIEFNLAVNPETVTPHAILINGEPFMSYNNLNLNPLPPLFMYPEDEYEWDD